MGPVAREPLEEYLLGRLPAVETERLDELSITDDEFVGRLRAVEHDLVDAYVRGDLDTEAHAAFEASYLASPLRREKVALARSFVQAIDRAAGTRVETRRRLPVWWTTAAAALAAAVMTAFLLRGAAGPVPPVVDPPAPQPPIATEPQPPRSVQPAPQTSTRVEVTSPTVLVPETRAPGGVATISAPAAGTAVGLELHLEANDFERYQATVKDPGADRVIWRSAWMPATTRGATAAVAIAVPGHVLKTQHYAVELSGRRGQGAGEIVHSYAFKVVAR